MNNDLMQQAACCLAKFRSNREAIDDQLFDMRDALRNDLYRLEMKLVQTFRHVNNDDVNSIQNQLDELEKIIKYLRSKAYQLNDCDA